MTTLPNRSEDETDKLVYDEFQCESGHHIQVMRSVKGRDVFVKVVFSKEQELTYIELTGYEALLFTKHGNEVRTDQYARISLRNRDGMKPLRELTISPRPFRTDLPTMVANFTVEEIMRLGRALTVFQTEFLAVLQAQDDQRR